MRPGLANPGAGDLVRLLAADSLLSWNDYNTRVVIVGTGLLGLAAGLVGSFALLRRRALLGDALSHATLPGICLAFLVVTAWGGDGKSLWGLLAGATCSGVLGILAILGINRLPRLKEDAALGIVLSVFFGAGICLLVLIQELEVGHAAGLESFIYGKTAAMLAGDAWLIGSVGCGAAIVAGLLFKELKLLCFDAPFARTQGYSQGGLDLMLMGLIVATTIIGLQAVGLILVIALLVIPPAAARFWTQRLETLMVLAAVLGGVAAIVGSAVSAIYPDLPAGATIVLVCSGLFLFSLLLGWQGGTVWRLSRRWQLQRRVAWQHLLRAVYEESEIKGGTATQPVAVEVEQVWQRRSWSRAALNRWIRCGVRRGALVVLPDGQIRLTSTGSVQAAKLAREHRLWELYLITHAEVAAGRVDRDADAIEHVLDPAMIAELERLLIATEQRNFVASPHPLTESVASVPATPETPS